MTSADARSMTATKCRSCAFAWNVPGRLQMQELEAVVEKVEFRDSFGWRLEHDPEYRPLMPFG